MNNEAETLTGWKFDELKDKDIHKTLHHRNNSSTELTEHGQMLSIFKKGEKYSSTDDFFTRKDGSEFPVSIISSPIIEHGKITSAVTAFRDLTIRKKLEKDREDLIKKLQHSLQTIKTLQGILPICASCKKIRNDEGCWIQIENYITHHSDADFSHGICPECAAVLYPEYCDAAAPSTKKNESSNS